MSYPGFTILGFKSKAGTAGSGLGKQSSHLKKQSNTVIDITDCGFSLQIYFSTKPHLSSTPSFHDII